MESSGAPSHQTVVRISWGQTHWDLTLWALLRVGTAASLRLRRSRPPAQGCGRQTATLGPHPSTRFNPDGVAAHPSFSHSSRPEPLRGSMVPPPIPRVGLIPFGRPWAGGRKPFGLRGRPPFHRLPRGGWGGALNGSARQHGPAHHPHGGRCRKGEVPQGTGEVPQGTHKIWIPGEASNPPRSHFSVLACSSEGLDLLTPNLWLGKASLPCFGLRLLHGGTPGER
jgi:hypothetical protein